MTGEPVALDIVVGPKSGGDGYRVPVTFAALDMATAVLREADDHIAQFFAFAHLPAHLQEVSAPFALMAAHAITTLPKNPERTVALRKLLEAKDAAVRAALAK